MLERTHSAIAPWYCVRADDKKAARRAIIAHILHQVAPAAIVDDLPRPDPDILFAYDPAAGEDGRLSQ